MTDLYEAGDINQTGGDADADDDDVNMADDDAVDEDEVDDEVDDEAGVGNELGPEDEGASLAVLSYLARSLSNDPDAVVIDADERRSGVRLSLHVAPEDMGRVIGRRGRTAQAIRTVVNVAAAKDGVQTSVDIVDD